MYIVFTLEDIAFYNFLRNFREFIKNPQFRHYLKKNNLPITLNNKIFNGLNRYYCGIPDNVLKYFRKEFFQLNSIEFDDRNIEHEKSIEIINQHQIRCLYIKNLSFLSIENVLEVIQEDNLHELTVNNVSFLPDCKIYQKDYKENYKFLKDFPSFKFVRKLNISHTNMRNFYFYFLTKEMNLIEDLNISNTFIHDLRLLKKFKKLKFLDCTGIAGATQYTIYLQFLKNLEYLRFGVKKELLSKLVLLININPVLEQFFTEEECNDFLQIPDEFKSKPKWNLSEFIELVHWKKLVFLDYVGTSSLINESIM